jgi:hypothetical protein
MRYKKLKNFEIEFFFKRSKNKEKKGDWPMGRGIQPVVIRGRPNKRCMVKAKNYYFPKYMRVRTRT